MEAPSTHSVCIGGRTLQLPVVPLTGAPISIALFDSLGDLELCDFLAEQLAAAARCRGIDPGCADVILTAGKAVTLAEAMAHRMRLAELSIAEKQPKNYWQTYYALPLRSITGQTQAQLVVGGRRADMLRGKRILIVDDVISTGQSIRALVGIAAHFGEPALVMAPFIEGDAGADLPRTVEGLPAVVLGRLPVWR